MMRPSEIRVWSLIWPSRVSRGSVRAVSPASVRIDLLALTTASAAPRAADSARPDSLGHAVHQPRGQRDPGVVGLGGVVLHGGDIGRPGVLPGLPAHPSATVGQVASPPWIRTTRPKCPARIITS